MGQNLDKFRAGQHDWEVFLVNALFLALDKPRLSDDQRKEWESDVKTLKGRTKDEYIEIAAAVEWALKVHTEWPKFIRRMKNVVDNVDRILRDYRAEMRAKRNADRAADGSEPLSLQRLRTIWPNTPKAAILGLEWDRRMKIVRAAVHKACKRCDENGNVLSPSGFKDAKGKLLLVPCPDCTKRLEPLSRKAWKKVQDELEGRAGAASA